MSEAILICGVTGTGKTMSLRNLKNMYKEGEVLYLDIEGGRRLPFKHNFTQKIIKSSIDLFAILDALAEKKGESKIKLIILDTLTYYMNLIEAEFVKDEEAKPKGNKLKAYGYIFDHITDLLQNKLAATGIDCVVLAHTAPMAYDDEGNITQIGIPTPGKKLSNLTIESFFNDVFAVKKMPVDQLVPNDLLNLTEKDKLLGFKHVIQTNVTKNTLNERIKVTPEMFTDNEVYIDNDCAEIFKRIHQFFA